MVNMIVTARAALTHSISCTVSHLTNWGKRGGSDIQFLSVPRLAREDDAQQQLQAAQDKAHSIGYPDEHVAHSLQAIAGRGQQWAQNYGWS